MSPRAAASVTGRRMMGGEALKKTPLHELHVGLGAKMVPFSGYDMPVQYKAGLMKEHNHCRSEASLFDVVGEAMETSPSEPPSRNVASAMLWLMARTHAKLSVSDGAEKKKLPVRACRWKTFERP